MRFMQNLEYFYDNPPEEAKFIARKTSIDTPKTILYGALGAGKSLILFDYISNFKKGEFLYINFADLRYEFLNLSDEFDKIFKFLEQNSQIIALFLDNLDEISPGEISHLQNLLNSAASQNLQSIIISTRKSSFELANFAKLKITPLCFEEFIAFDKRHSEINAIISAFFSQGGSVGGSLLHHAASINSEQNALKSALSANEIKILKECAAFVAASFSANKIYMSLKEKIRISKDSVYAAIAKFDDENFINFIPKFGDEKAAKKMFFSNFNLKEILGFKKDFVKKFLNAVYCELANLGAPIYYTKDLDFYLPSRNLGVLVVPFSASEIVFLRFKKLILELKRLKITRLAVISMANTGALEIEGIKCEVVPFHSFALGL
ncbi:AAA family ATPase [Campylobacter sp. JMF_01 NE2]|uniref:AAA family ATPase n=2 Tax=unclassified Campylobacter TaxID=2593542 RepID=UPI0022EA00C7|nr:AAA family ATPase [Campylobacter sp. JMF_03 NE3]MDA3066632.1 AAA family ATPase [Campylobacter sp. JMF_01 NE2]